MKLIKLTLGKTAIVDDADFEQLSQRNWRVTFGQKKRKKFYAISGSYKKTVLMHRLLMDCPPGMMVDHIKGNGLDNQRSNLRVCSVMQNNANRKLFTTGASGFRGVFKKTDYSRKNPWYARAGLKKGQRLYAHGFSTPEEAAMAYDKLAKQLYGNFAVLNFPNQNN